MYGLSYVEHLSYLGIFLAVAFSGYIIPLPEEVILIIAGYMVAQGILSLPAIIVVCILGAICGDTLIYYLSGHGSRFTQKYHDHARRSYFGWYIHQINDRPFATIFLSRFVVGMRFLSPLVSGLTRVKARIFVPATALSALIYIPFIIMIGFYGSDRISTVLTVAHSVRQGILLAIVTGSLIMVLLFLRNSVLKKVAFSPVEKSKK